MRRDVALLRDTLIRSDLLRTWMDRGVGMRLVVDGTDWPATKVELTLAVRPGETWLMAYEVSVSSTGDVDMRPMLNGARARMVKRLKFSHLTMITIARNLARTFVVTSYGP